MNFERGIWLHSVDGGVVRGNQVTGSRPYLIAPDQNRDVGLSD